MELCHRCCVDYSEINEMERERYSNALAETQAEGQRGVQRAERPMWTTPNILFRMAAQYGEPTPERQQRTYPIGARLAQVIGGEDTGCILEVVAFAPNGLKEMGDLLDAYVVRSVPSGETERMACYELHDEAEWRRMDRAPNKCGYCGKDGGDESLLHCSACKGAKYCGRECQKEHWAEHKPTCLRARGESVSRSVMEASEQAKQKRMRKEEESAIASIAMGDTNGARDSVLMCTGHGFIDEMWASGIEAHLSARARAIHIDVSTPDGRVQAASSIRRGEVRSAILLGIGSGAGDVRGMLNDAAFRGAMIFLVRNGGTVMVHGEGATLKTVLVSWFEQAWGGGSQAYTRETLESATSNASWGNALQRSATASSAASEVYMKCVFIDGVPTENAIHSRVPYQDEDFGDSDDEPATRQDRRARDLSMKRCSIAAGALGSGVAGFFGDVNASDSTCAMIASLCSFA